MLNNDQKSALMLFVFSRFQTIHTELAEKRELSYDVNSAFFNLLLFYSQRSGKHELSQPRFTFLIVNFFIVIYVIMHCMCHKRSYQYIMISIIFQATEIYQ